MILLAAVLACIQPASAQVRLETAFQGAREAVRPELDVTLRALRETSDPQKRLELLRQLEWVSGLQPDAEAQLRWTLLDVAATKSAGAVVRGRCLLTLAKASSGFSEHQRREVVRALLDYTSAVDPYDSRTDLRTYALMALNELVNSLPSDTPLEDSVALAAFDALDRQGSDVTLGARLLERISEHRLRVLVRQPSRDRMDREVFDRMRSELDRIVREPDIEYRYRLYRVVARCGFIRDYANMYRPRSLDILRAASVRETDPRLRQMLDLYVRQLERR